MSNFNRLLTALRPYRSLVSLAIVSNILTAVFTVISIPLLKPFLDILFAPPGELSTPPPLETSQLSSSQDWEMWLNNNITNWVIELGRETVLGYVCLAILSAFLLKNLFRYLALFSAAPCRDAVTRDLRLRLADKPRRL